MCICLSDAEWYKDQEGRKKKEEEERKKKKGERRKKKKEEEEREKEKKTIGMPGWLAGTSSATAA